MVKSEYIAALAAELVAVEILAAKMDVLAEEYFFQEKTWVFDELSALSLEYEDKSNFVMHCIKQLELHEVREGAEMSYAVTS